MTALNSLCIVGIFTVAGFGVSYAGIIGGNATSAQQSSAGDGSANIRCSLITSNGITAQYTGSNGLPMKLQLSTQNEFYLPPMTFDTSSQA